MEEFKLNLLNQISLSLSSSVVFFPSLPTFQFQIGIIASYCFYFYDFSQSEGKTVEITIVTRSTSLSQNLCVILHQVLAGAAAQFYGFVSFLTLSSALLGFTVTSQFSLNILPCGLRCKRHLNVWTHLVGLYLDERINMCL